MIINYQSSIINKKAITRTKQRIPTPKYTLATIHILGYIVRFELTQYDIRNTEYELCDTAGC
jgi:hypothetical protein